jgi:hypothetical protein
MNLDMSRILFASISDGAGLKFLSVKRHTLSSPSTAVLLIILSVLLLPSGGSDSNDDQYFDAQEKLTSIAEEIRNK